MARPSGAKTRNAGRWTEARFRSFVTGNIRRFSMKWPPISECLKNARISRGIYLCNGCKQEVTASIKIDGKRIKNVHVDHINPVVDPKLGWTSWDDVIERMFIEPEGLQVLCYECHTVKTNEERALHKERRIKEKEAE